MLVAGVARNIASGVSLADSAARVFRPDRVSGLALDGSALGSVHTTEAVAPGANVYEFKE